MNIVIPYQYDQQGGELIYTLRAAEKFIGECELTIVGNKPKGLDGYRWVPFDPQYNTLKKEKNIFDKLRAAGINHFTALYDDEILLAPFNPVPVTIPWFGIGQYKNSEENTKSHLGEGALNYDRHYPFVFELEKLNELAELNWDQKYGYCIKSLYGNTFKIPHTVGVDCKIRYTPVKENWKEWDCVSTAPYVWEAIKSEIVEMFKEKSKWEI